MLKNALNPNVNTTLKWKPRKYTIIFGTSNVTIFQCLLLVLLDLFKGKKNNGSKPISFKY